MIYYLSLSGPTGWIGGLLVDAADWNAAVELAGQVVKVPDGTEFLIMTKPAKTPTPDPRYMNRLLDRDELAKAVGPTTEQPAGTQLPPNVDLR